MSAAESSTRTDHAGAGQAGGAKAAAVQAGAEAVLPRGFDRVLIVADPGAPTAAAEEIRPALAAAVEATLGSAVQVDVRTAALVLTPDYDLDMSAAEELAERTEPAHATVFLTEIPRHTGGHPLISEVFTAPSIAVVSLPTFGAVARQSRLISVMTASIVRMLAPEAESEEAAEGEAHAAGGTEPAPTSGTGESGTEVTDASGVDGRVITPVRDPAGALRETARPVRGGRWTYVAADGEYQLHAHSLLGGPRLAIGMIASNAPWTAVPQLSGALAAAAATGAFGIFYSSIWQMADYLSTARLIVIGMLAVAIVVTWLMLGHRLWDRPVRESVAAVTMLYNLSTVITLLVGVALIFVILFTVIFASSLIVIDAAFMTDVLGSQATWSDYVELAWLSAALGLFAGAVGASFDSDADLRRLTHGQRERQRISSAAAAGEPDVEQGVAEQGVDEQRAGEQRVGEQAGSAR